MSIIDRLRSALRGLRDTVEDPPEDPAPTPEATDGHAPGHRHLGPPPDQPPPSTTDTKGSHDQPWIRTSHSDSQSRRFRR